MRPCKILSSKYPIVTILVDIDVISTLFVTRIGWAVKPFSGPLWKEILN